MAHYKHIDTSPRLLAVDLKRQLLPGTFEHALDHLLAHEIDLSALDARFKNDETGASAYPFPDEPIESAGGSDQNQRRDSPASPT